MKAIFKSGCAGCLLFDANRYITLPNSPRCIALSSRNNKISILSLSRGGPTRTDKSLLQSHGGAPSCTPRRAEPNGCSSRPILHRWYDYRPRWMYDKDIRRSVYGFDSIGLVGVIPAPGSVPSLRWRSGWSWIWW